jgi:hypothetical protein
MDFREFEKSVLDGFNSLALGLFILQAHCRRVRRYD